MAHSKHHFGDTRGLIKANPEKITKSPENRGFLEQVMAGAEGFEPSARGFGVAVENDFLYNVPLLSQTLTNP